MLPAELLQLLLKLAHTHCFQLLATPTVMSFFRPRLCFFVRRCQLDPEFGELLPSQRSLTRRCALRHCELIGQCEIGAHERFGGATLQRNMAEVRFQRSRDLCCNLRCNLRDAVF